MSIDKIDLRNRMGRVRQAFLKVDCHSLEVLVNKYKLPLTFLHSLCELGLLVNERDKLFCRSAAWSRESNMTLTRLINIVTGKTKLQSSPPPTQLPQVPPEKAEMHDTPINTPFLGNIIRSRKSLTMGFKLTKAKQFQAELSWYSSQPFSTIESNSDEARRRYYEQEAFELEGQVYRVIDLETHMLKALKQFFDGVPIETKIRRIHHE